MNKEKLLKELQEVEVEIKKWEANYWQAMGIQKYIQKLLKEIDDEKSGEIDNSQPAPN